ncbi:alpha-glucosidase C-terminal domain-containing protein, partial [Bacillus pseudomycoides]|nr:alpha-glucosidase C-terminal domain-containing protein [Bacillus pseudomycoides]
VITDGKYEIIDMKHPNVWVYTRKLEDEVLLVVNNFYEETITYSVPEEVRVNGMKQEILISNYEDSGEDIRNLILRPYESIVYRFTK